MNKKFRLSTGFVYAFLILHSIVVLLPVLWTVSSSVKPGSSMFSTSFFEFGFTLDHYKELLFHTDYPMWFLNTFKIAFANMAIGLTLTTITAYIFSRYNFKGKKKVMMNILILQMFPAFLSMTAIFILLAKLNLIDSYGGLLLVYTAGRVPFDTWLIKGYFDALPQSLDEAARVDGAGHMTIFFKIVMPLAKPILVFIALTGFTAPWLDFIFPTLIIRSAEKKTLAVGIFEWILGSTGNEYTLFAAGAILIAVPISILFVILQRHISKGLLSGAVKS